MNSIEKLSELINGGYFHCSQALLKAFAEELGISEEPALKKDDRSGAGRNEGEVCGYVMGTLMAIWLKCGQYKDKDKDDDMDSRTKERELGMRFFEKFKAENDSCIRRDLLDCDFDKPEEAKLIQETKLYANICPKLVESAARIAVDILLNTL